jgi:hypothetical protein
MLSHSVFSSISTRVLVPVTYHLYTSIQVTMSFCALLKYLKSFAFGCMVGLGQAYISSHHDHLLIAYFRRI